MSNIVELLETVTLESEVYNTYEGNWQQYDQLSFARKIFAEAIMDKLYWLTSGKKGSANYYDMKKRDVASAQQNYRGDEISTNELRGAIANAKAAGDKHDALMQMFADLQELYRTTMDTNGNDYHPYGAPKMGNIPEQPSDIPEDIAQELAALGIEMAEPEKKKA